MKSYATQLVRQAFHDFHIRTDIWFAAISVVAGAFAGPGHQTVSDITGNDIAVFVLVFVAAYTALRLLVFSPYKMWKTAQNALEVAQAEIASPQHKVLLGMADHKIDCYKKLSEAVAILSHSTRTTYEFRKSRGIDSVQLLETCVHYSEQFRYDEKFEELASKFINACVDINYKEGDKKPDFTDFNEASIRFLEHLHKGC